jgi:hypothetical protein
VTIHEIVALDILREQRLAPKPTDADRRKAFYNSRAWRQARYQALKISNRCQCCGDSPNDGARLVVDHIFTY